MCLLFSFYFSLSLSFLFFSLSSPFLFLFFSFSFPFLLFFSFSFPFASFSVPLFPFCFPLLSSCFVFVSFSFPSFSLRHVTLVNDKREKHDNKGIAVLYGVSIQSQVSSCNCNVMFGHFKTEMFVSLTVIWSPWSCLSLVTWCQHHFAHTFSTFVCTFPVLLESNTLLAYPFFLDVGRASRVCQLFPHSLTVTVSKTLKLFDLT